MSLDIIFLFKELETFTKNIQNHKNTILAHGAKTKLKNKKFFIVLEKLLELEAIVYKTFSLYVYKEKKIDQDMIIDTFNNIEYRIKQFLKKSFL